MRSTDSCTTYTQDEDLWAKSDYEQPLVPYLFESIAGFSQRYLLKKDRYRGTKVAANQTKLQTVHGELKSNDAANRQ